MMKEIILSIWGLTSIVILGYFTAVLTDMGMVGEAGIGFIPMLYILTIMARRFKDE